MKISAAPKGALRRSHPALPKPAHRACDANALRAFPLSSRVSRSAVIAATECKDMLAVGSYIGPMLIDRIVGTGRGSLDNIALGNRMETGQWVTDSPRARERRWPRRTMECTNCEGLPCMSISRSTVSAALETPPSSSFSRRSTGRAPCHCSAIAARARSMALRVMSQEACIQ